MATEAQENSLVNGTGPSTCPDEDVHPVEELRDRARTWGVDMTSEEFAARMDQEDPLKDFRQMFHIPKCTDLPNTDASLVKEDEESVYLCGNSLGLQPKGVRHHTEVCLDLWAKAGVQGHTKGKIPFAFCDEMVNAQNAVLVGAKTEEVAIMNGLTVNLHLMLVSFYRPTPQRHKVLLEDHSFPSDHYTVESQIRWHGYDPATSMICLKPREGEHLLRHEDILDTIEREGDSIAVLLVPGVQYYTGQLVDMEAITKAGQAKGCYVGIDLAHSIGNVEIHLHDWGVDFAAWCTYKYLNGGAGCIAGAFLHQKHADNDFPKLTGWWGHRTESRFNMTNELERSSGIAGYRISNPPPLLCASLLASMEVFMKTSIRELRTKSKLVTGYLEYLLRYHYPKPPTGEQRDRADQPYVDIITPTDPNQRGAQLSVMFSVPVERVHDELTKRGVALDMRKPNVLRVAPAPLYNSFKDVHRFVYLLGQAMHLSREDQASTS